jgi:Ca-activated chloride channel family protein
MPLIPGDDEVRYILNQDHKISARQMITVEPLDVTLDAGETAEIAEPFLVTWVGPDYKNDYISVAEIGSTDNDYIKYTYTKQGSPLRLSMPSKSGQYEIRYIANGSPDKVLARKTVNVEDIEANVILVGEAKVGEAALIEWTGPDYQNDYIAISEIGTNSYIKYTYTKQGSPLRVQMPDKAGTYELRYFINQDSTIIAREQIEVK